MWHDAYIQCSHDVDAQALYTCTCLLQVIEGDSSTGTQLKEQPNNEAQRLHGSDTRAQRELVLPVERRNSQIRI